MSKSQSKVLSSNFELEEYSVQQQEADMNRGDRVKIISIAHDLTVAVFYRGGIGHSITRSGFDNFTSEC